MKLYGIVGPAHADKTDLIARVVSEICGRGFTVSTVQQAHHVFDVDQPGKDSYRHRTAGATEVLLSSRKRFALMHEMRGSQEPALDDLLAKLASVDLVLVEGYGDNSHSKVEVFLPETGTAPMAPEDPTIKAVASDTSMDLDRPVFDLGDARAVADFILREVSLT